MLKTNTKFSPISVVKEYFGEIDDELASTVLWTCTGWPGFFSTDENNNIEDCLRKQLQEISTKANKSPHLAIKISDDELDLAMKNIQNED